MYRHLNWTTTWGQSSPAQLKGKNVLGVTVITSRLLGAAPAGLWQEEDPRGELGDRPAAERGRPCHRPVTGVTGVEGFPTWKCLPLNT